MKMAIFVVMLVFSAMAQADGVSGRYVGYDMVAGIAEQQDGIAFEISSNVDQSACSIDGVAKPIDGARAVFSPADPGDKCVVVLTFTTDSLKVTTKDCDGYCGMGAEGSMDGVYMKK